MPCLLFALSRAVRAERVLFVPLDVRVFCLALFCRALALPYLLYRVPFFFFFFFVRRGAIVRVHNVHPIYSGAGLVGLGACLRTTVQASVLILEDHSECPYMGTLMVTDRSPLT